MFFIASFLKYGLTTKFVFTNDSEVKVGIDLIENEIRGPIGTNEIVFFESTKYTVDDPEYQVAVETLTAEIAELGPDIIRPESLGNFYSNGLPFLVSEDRGSTLITLIMAGDFDQNADNIEAVVDVVHEYAATETGNFVSKVTGQATIGFRQPRTEPRGPGKRRGHGGSHCLHHNINCSAGGHCSRIGAAGNSHSVNYRGHRYLRSGWNIL
jgi:hypothetical protein